MAGSKLIVVLSQAQGRNPARIELVDEIAAALRNDPDVDVLLLPHLYDSPRDHSGMQLLQSTPADLVVLAWLYPRATRWILDRNGVTGRTEVSSLSVDGEQPSDKTVQRDPCADRSIYCIDLRFSTEPAAYVDEIHRIAGETKSEVGGRKSEVGSRSFNPQSAIRNPKSTDGPVKRRWYPVIDYDRCTNCMECIDFCLFGVYGVDGRGRILVEEQDNCKQGCPACSRVCPENAILFPGHKMPAIAGADGEIASLKLDLSKVFGAAPAVEIAAQERDIELLRAGRKTAATADGVSQERTGEAQQDPDDLDELIDELDKLDL